MVKVDLITGFLGSGKTTFIKKYARYLMEQGQNIGILENDFGDQCRYDAPPGTGKRELRTGNGCGRM